MAVLLVVGLGSMYAELAAVWSIPLKAVLALLHFWGCTRLFRVRLDRLEL
jgi:hypothetical protein